MGSVARFTYDELAALLDRWKAAKAASATRAGD